MNDQKAVYPIERQSLSEQVYHYIKRMILSGELQGGEKIPEEKIAQLFGVSRTPIREALRRLDEYGLIYLKPRSYAIVVDFDPKEAEQVAQVRAQLETLAVSLLADKGTEEDFAAVEKLAQECHECIQKEDIAATFEKDSQLHLEIAKRSGNRHLYEIFEKIDAKVQLLRLVVHLPVEKLKMFINQHRAIIEALRKHDSSKAEALMKAHILQQLQHYHEETQ
ncbi:GntR family transcriptional regulator [candidate division KSB3 bacterium]|uniref:GntR family transcriptional regulator n=1 Tax=candidate division KSB3 bacterium TaxID=2044937 RepID=A0A2G6KHT1_9BACT|nr:MAG: GntR family transcriptional regulator [candidate division KSB3 bacterium]